MGFKDSIRMDDGHFSYLLSKVKNAEKQTAFLREVLPVKRKLEITLKFLTTSKFCNRLQCFFRVPKRSISKFF